MLLANVGPNDRNISGATNVTLVFDDNALSYCPTNTLMVSGTYKPTYALTNDYAFPGVAPAYPLGTNLAIFNGTAPDGTWNLFVLDSASPDSGVISNGWSLTITATAADIPPTLLSIVQDDPNVVLSWTNTLVGFTLQTTPSISGTPIWTTAAPPAVVVGGRFTVTNAASGTSRFYRLVK
jgi:hypothetical protein